MSSSTAHACIIGRARVGDTLVRADGTRSEVTDTQHYLTPFVGRTADVWTADGRKINGWTIAAIATIAAGPDHPAHD